MTHCPHCKTTIKHGSRYACCSGCGGMFVGQTAFDAHQRVVDGVLVCLMPHEAVNSRTGEYLLEGGDKDGWFVHRSAQTGPNPWAKT